MEITRFTLQLAVKLTFSGPFPAGTLHFLEEVQKLLVGCFKVEFVVQVPTVVPAPKPVEKKKLVAIQGSTNQGGWSSSR